MMTVQLGDAKAREQLRHHESVVRQALAEYGGTEVKAMGDGFMVFFYSVCQALKCAVAMQKAFGEPNGLSGAPVRVRMGLNAGEPIAEDDDLFGETVILASRIASHARGGQILVSNVVKELAAGKDFTFSDAGEVLPKGFEEVVRLYQLGCGEGMANLLDGVP